MSHFENTVYLPELTEYRQQCTKRRAEAFCDAPEYVLGIEVRPLTPATFSMLVATDSAFLMGGQPREHDVRNYLWFHSRLYAHCGVQDWRRRKTAALHQLTAQLSPAWRRRLGLPAPVGRFVSVLTKAIVQIRLLVDEAFADSPPKSGRPSKPIATTEAYFVHEFSLAYHWPPQKTSNTPLRQLIQLHRCIRSGRGEEISDDGEDRIWAAYLDVENAKLESQRKEAAVT
jgi:hypothetical protein